MAHSDQRAGPDIRAGRLPAETLAEHFGDAHPPLDGKQAVIESSRCYFCYDAPCIEACPTGIDIPAFIRSIQTGNVIGAGETILSANIMGGTCSRVCPVEELCEQACVRNLAEDKPVAIGNLQRFATDSLFAEGHQPFARAAPTSRRIAIVGAGPAGMACAHRLAVLGHEVTVFEARARGGGLNEYGIAAYKMAGGFARTEMDFILGVGGIELRPGQRLGREVSLAGLREGFDAVFLGLGHNAVNDLGLEGEMAIEGVLNAVDYIEGIRSSDSLDTLTVGRRVVVIGGGNTAIDAATQAKRLGAEDVTIVYRRGPAQMSATGKEQAWAQTNGVRIKYWARPVSLLTWPGPGRRQVQAVEFEYTQLGGDGRLAGTGDRFVIPADQVFKAIGQRLQASGAGLGDLLELDGDRIAVDAARATSLDLVYAGGDCVRGKDLTVSAVEDGKIAAGAIHHRLS